MVYCEECNTKLGILQGYRHPVLGTRFLVCGNCYDEVYGDMERRSTFCLSDSFNAELSKIGIQSAWNTNISNDPFLQNWFDNLWIKIDNQAYYKI
jgi:hypothetical protein